MRICDRCKGEPIVLMLTNSKEGSHYDLCPKCQDEFYRFMGMPKEEPKEETGPGNTKKEEIEPKKGPGRPRKNGKD